MDSAAGMILIVVHVNMKTNVLKPYKGLVHQLIAQVPPATEIIYRGIGNASREP